MGKKKKKKEDEVEEKEEEFTREVPLTKDFTQARKNFPHFDAYIKELESKGKMPEFYPELKREMSAMKYPNLIYPVGDPIFIHISREKGGPMQYTVIEPRLDEEEEKLYEKIIDELVYIAYKEEVPAKTANMTNIFKKYLKQLTHVEGDEEGFIEKFEKKVSLTKQQYKDIEYYLLRNRIGYGKLEPLFYDPNLEDIHCTGVGVIKTIHKMFGMVYTNIDFRDDKELNRYIVDVSERVERPTSDAHAVVDAMMPDGSRVNFIYGRDISREGSSFTIRKFASTPVSITQVVNWGTMSAELAAYMWIALESGMNIFVCGETASGKTTTLNAMSAFIKPTDKIYTVENTPEVTMPHDVWQHLVTREAGKESDVGYLDLLIAALRSRPNYIIVGEIRGVEGSIAFQAMQTGHPVMSTFHAGNVTTMIQRITGDPINVPIAFVDNLNIVLIQQAVFNGTKFVRRVLNVSELERFYAPANKVVTREVFSWGADKDVFSFRGKFNSYILEQKIAKLRGYTDPKQIYEEVDLRKRIIERMIEEKIFNYYEVWEILKNFYFEGISSLPFKL
ncbi:MAG: type II/IV secretion system ATPase subunit [Candidatus Woesearchaeota archaeon]